MVKRVITLCILAVMLFSLTACQAQGLAKYKNDAKEELESYAMGKGIENYSATDWGVLLGLLEEGKEKIDACIGKVGVDSALLTAMGEIDGVMTLSELEEYKLTAKTELEKHAASKGARNYLSDKWETMQAYLEEGKAAVESATNKNEVDAVILSVKVQIDGVEKIEGMSGAFYTLTEAYNNGWLSVEDLESIAYYHNNSRNNTEPYSPDKLNAEVEAAIKESRAAYCRAKGKQNNDPSQSRATADDVTIRSYYGAYGDCVATMITDRFQAYLDLIWEETVGGVVFTYGNSNYICIWKENA